jgi:hypothetical protein
MASELQGVHHLVTTPEHAVRNRFARSLPDVRSDRSSGSNRSARPEWEMAPGKLERGVSTRDTVPDARHTIAGRPGQLLLGHLTTLR